MNTDPPHDLRDLEAPQAAPVDLQKEIELRLNEEQVKLLKSRTAFCSNCGKEMNKSGRNSLAKTGICLNCQPGSRVVEVQANGSHKLISRRERRHPNGVKNKRKKHG